ncbi:MAG: DHH family phosphoesterase, partial [Nanoarchaeota archaeon]|nr:DHH family phosphoesterase [Nanoarchaeota archaeon]
CALISDHQYDLPKALGFIRKIEDKYKFKKSDNFWESELGKLSNVLINSAIYFGDKEQECFELMKRINSPKDIDLLKKYSDEIDLEVKRIEDDFKSNRKIHSWGYMHNLESKFNLTSSISTRLSDDTPDKILIFYSESNGLVKISARRSDSKFDCNDLLKETTRDIPNCSKGGHAPAAGATFKAEYFEQFKKNLFDILSKS